MCDSCLLIPLCDSRIHDPFLLQPCSVHPIVSGPRLGGLVFVLLFLTSRFVLLVLPFSCSNRSTLSIQYESMERRRRIVLEDEEEEEAIQIGGVNVPNDETMALCLIGKLWTERSYNTFALMETMKKLWCPSKGLICRDLGNNMIAFQFNSARDMKRVQAMEPWHFNKHALVLKQISKDTQPSGMEFDEIPMWIRIYDLPISGREITTIRQIGKRVGEVVEIDKETITSLTRSVRLKVVIQLGKPLKRGIKIRIGQAEPCWLPITYERLPSFCYYYGRLGHTQKDCDKLEEKDAEITEEFRMVILCAHL